MNERNTNEPQTPQRWLVLQATALLDSVATMNTACYGRGGVPHYPVLKPAPPQPEVPTLCVELHINAPDGTARLVLLDLDLTQQPQPAESKSTHTVWQAYNAARRMQVIWVWDFYRILSHIAVRIGLPTDGQASDALWQSVLDAARAMHAGDTIEVKVQSRCGNINQQHTIEHAPHEWAPGK